MSKLLKWLGSVSLSLLLLTTVISIVMNFSIKRTVQKETISDLPEVRKSIKTAQRVRHTEFSIPLNNVAPYNYFWYNSIRNGSVSEKHFTAIDTNFYKSNKLKAASLEMLYTGILRPDMSFNIEKATELKKYYESVNVAEITRSNKRKNIVFSDIQWIKPFLAENLAVYQVNYAENSERVKAAILSQLQLSHLFADKNTLMQNVVITPGFASEELVKRYGETRARAIALGQVAKNIFDGLRAFEKTNGASNLRLLFVNSFKPDAVKSSIAVLGEGLLELKKLRDAILSRNRSYGRPVKNLAERVGYAIDTSALIHNWYSTKTTLFKTLDGKPLSKSLFAQRLVTSLSRSEKQIKLMYLSYNILGDGKIEEKPLNSPEYLPYTRALNRSVLNQQIELFRKIYELSSIGIDEQAGYLVLAMPRRQIFNGIHYVFAPIIYLVSDENIRSSLVYKANGAYRSEQVDSLNYLRAYLNSHIR